MERCPPIPERAGCQSPKYSFISRLGVGHKKLPRRSLKEAKETTTMIQWTWLVYTSLWAVAVGSSIRVNELTGLDPSQGDQNSIGILNTIFTNNVGPTTTRGLLIDAGSGGSRLHVYEWQPRVFKQVPPPISYPTTNEAYTGRISNGVQLCWRENQTEEDLLENLTNHLAPLLDFARSALTDQGMQDQFATIPIWFKATGGVRLPFIF